MVSSFARWLVRMQCYNLSGTFLSIASKIIGKGFRITYNKDGFWRHAKGDMVINEAFPNIRMDPGLIRKEVQISFYDYEPKEKDICIDIGAGIGTECISTSKMIGPLGRIYAVEASPFIYKILETNVLENSLNNVSCYNLAIGDQNGKIKISDNLNDHIVNNIWGNEGVDVEARTMDDFISSLGLREIDFLRVNIEGAEKLLISKYVNISNTRHVAIACHDFLTRRSGDPQFTTKKKVSDFLASHDFLIKSSNTGVDYIDDWVYGVNKKFLSPSMQRSDK